MADFTDAERAAIDAYLAASKVTRIESGGWADSLPPAWMARKHAARARGAKKSDAGRRKRVAAMREVTVP